MISVNTLMITVALVSFMWLMVFVAIAELQHRERKDLYTRLMCRDMREYNGAAKAETTVKTPKTGHRAVLERWRKVE